MDQRATSAASGRKALPQHTNDGIELRALEAPIRPSTPAERIQLLLTPFARADLSHDLLRQHVQGLFGDGDAVELAALAGSDQRRAFDQIVSRLGK